MFKFITTIFLILSISFSAFAEDDGRLDGVFDIPNERKDDSCIQMYSFDRLINILATLGIYYWFSNDFRMIHPEGETETSCTNPVKNGDDISEEDREGIKYVYIPSFFGLFDVGPVYKPNGKGLKDGETISHGLISLRGKNVGDMLCVQWAMTLGYRTVGCKYRQMPKYEGSGGGKCYVSTQLCSNRVLEDSKSFLPVTAPLVECVHQAVKTFFLGDGTENCKTALAAFQENLRNIVMMLLTLYIIFFGIKLTLVREVSKGEAFLFLMKMLLVIYFSVGFRTSGGYSHGVEEIFNFFIGAAIQLSQIAVTAGNEGGLCMYPMESYSNKMIMAWDYLDCRMGYYLGINSVARTGANILGSIATLLGLMFNPLFLLIALITLLFACFFIGIIMHVVHSFMISLIVITIITFLAPIFVPMALFNQTKQMYEGWLKTLIGNTVQPIILMSFLAFMFAIMDDIIFPTPGCKWQQANDQSTTMTNFMNTMFGSSMGNRTWTMWELKINDEATSQEQADCKTSFGFLMQCIGSSGTEGCPKDDEFWQACANAMDSVLQSLLFMFLFFFFIGMVESIAADISGVQSMGGAVSPMALFNKAMEYTQQAAGKGAAKVSKAIQSKTSRGGGKGGGAGGAGGAGGGGTP